MLSRAKSGWGRLLDIVLRSGILARRCDVVLVNVYAHRAFVYEAIVILYARLWKKRVVVLLRSGELPEFIQSWPRLTRLIFRQPHLVLVPHEFLKSRLSALGLRVDGIIPNFIELENYTFRVRSTLAPRFLYLRGMHSYYNPSMAIRAFSLIQKKHPDALLTMAGPEGSESSNCRTLVRELGLRNVHFVGVVPKEQIPLLADKHDIHLHTNNVENMPITIIEMWACGLPIIGTEVGGMPYLVRNGIDGILVKPDDYQNMANACLKLLSNSELAATLCSNGRARAEEFTWESVKHLWQEALSLQAPATAANAF
jgi:glycosyltransferase involved in cell wall biosynthesis